MIYVYLVEIPPIASYYSKEVACAGMAVLVSSYITSSWAATVAGRRADIRIVAEIILIKLYP